MRRRRRRLWLLVLVVLVAWGAARWTAAQMYPWEFRALTQRTAVSSDLDPFTLAALVQAESGWDPGATSRQGALGLMQVMPDTARFVARRIGVAEPVPEKLYDPELNLRLGAWYLADLRRQFGGRMVPAIAAYNSGAENVQQWLAQGRWDGTAAHADRIPFAETRAYVQRIDRSTTWYRRLYDRHSLMSWLLWPLGR